MGPPTTIEAVEGLVRANERLLAWATIAGWATIGLAALGLSFRARGRDRWAWAGTAALSILFAVEMASPHRYALAVRAKSALRAFGGEEAIRGRRPIQAAVILILLIVASGLLAWFLGRRGRLSTPARWAVVGTGVALLGLLLETISLHQIDLYYTIYWSIWLAGIATALIGVGSGFGVPAGPAPAATPPPRSRSSAASLGLRREDEPPLRRASRMVLLMIALAAPELVELASRLIAAR